MTYYMYRHDIMYTLRASQKHSNSQCCSSSSASLEYECQSLNIKIVGKNDKMGGLCLHFAQKSLLDQTVLSTRVRSSFMNIQGVSLTYYSIYMSTARKKISRSLQSVIETIYYNEFWDYSIQTTINRWAAHIMDTQALDTSWSAYSASSLFYWDDH